LDVQEVKKLDAYLKRLFGNARIRVVPKKNESADVFVGEERIGGLVLDEDEEDDERSYNFEMKITLGDAATAAPDIKKLDAYLKRKFDNERVRVVPRFKKKDSAEVYVGQEYIGVLFFDETDARSSYFELPILAFRDGTPYQGEDLIYDAEGPGFLVRCTRRVGPTPGTCLYERWIDTVKLVMRFPRDWLADWRAVAGNIDRLIASLRPSRG